MCGNNPKELKHPHWKHLTGFGWVMEGDKLYILQLGQPRECCCCSAAGGSLIRGCKCRTGCGTLWCGCKKNGEHCSEGCERRNYCNTAPPQPVTNIPLHHLPIWHWLRTWMRSGWSGYLVTAMIRVTTPSTKHHELHISSTLMVHTITTTYIHRRRIFSEHALLTQFTLAL